MKKKILGLILVMCMMTGFAHITADAATSGICGEGVKWALDDSGTLTISGSGDMTDYGYSSDAPWRSRSSSITDIIIENGVTGIGASAFEGYYNNLKIISIPPSVNKIGNNAFGTYDSTAGVYISDLAAWFNINFNGNESNPLHNAGNLYLNNELLTDLVVPDGVTSICENAFYKCASITDVSISQDVTEIGDKAFMMCPNLRNVSISSGVKKIGETVFFCCNSLLSIEVDANNENYASDDGVLFDKAKTTVIQYPLKKENTSYAIPDSVKSVECGAFCECKNLKNITIPDSVTYIGDYAFEECSNLESLIIPDGVTTISFAMAVNCEKLAYIKFPDSITSIYQYVIDGTAYYKDASNWIDGVLYVDNCLMEISESVSGHYQVRDGTVVIGDWAFYCGDKVTGVSIPESVNGIGVDAFIDTALYDDASNWTGNALYIDNCLVAVKKELSGDYQIQEGTRLIAEGAFWRADSITSITIPASVTIIGNEAFNMNNNEVDLAFMAQTAVNLGKNILWDDVRKIYIHEGYIGYTAENGYDESKIVIKPHNYEDGVCSVCGVKKSMFSIERVDGNSDAEYTFNVKSEQAYENCYVYAAVYDADGAMIEVKHVPLETTGDTSVSVNKSEKDKTAGVFVWTGNIQPMATKEFIVK